MHGDFWWIGIQGEGLYWAWRDQIGAEPGDEGWASDWSELPVAAGDRAVLCVPGDKVRIHRVQLPMRSRRRFREALPFALEEELLHKPEDYHFVPLGPPGMEGGTPVAVVEGERMERWTGAAEERGLRLRLLVPEPLAVAPPPEGVWQLDLTASPLLLRGPGPEAAGALLPESGEGPPGSLLLALEARISGGISPETLRVRVASATDAERVRGWSRWLDPYGVAVEAVEDPRPRPAWLARQPLPAARLNLLTGAYASGEDPAAWLRRLAPTGVLALLLVLVAGGQWLHSGQQLRAEHQALREEIERIYREAFPDARKLIDPRYQMAQRLERLRKRASQNATQGFLDRIGQLASVLAPEGGAVRLKALRYAPGDLELALSLPSYRALERLKKRLKHHGSVKVASASLKEGRVHCQIRLKSGGD